MKAIVFCGPTVDRETIMTELPGAVVLGPATCGDVYRASQGNPGAIALVDGYFDHRLSVWHKEVLWALSRGQRVYGASSMGALRAAELASFGMIGVGRIFGQFARGELEDDDEVAVVHESDEGGYRQRSEAMVNIRATLAAAARAQAISPEAETKLRACAKARFYADRSYAALLRDAPMFGIGPDELRALAAFLEAPGPVNQKRIDALEMLRLIRADSEHAPAHAALELQFSYTNAWDRFRQKIQEEDAGRTRVVSETPAAVPAEIVELGEQRRWLERLEQSDPPLAAAVRIGALERALSLKLADEEAWEPDAATMQAAAVEFCAARGLLSPQQVEAWMAENDLDAASFSALIYDEISTLRFREAAQRLGVGQVASALRSSAMYSGLKVR